MTPTKASKVLTKQPRKSTTSGVNKKSKAPRETKEARERRQELATALIVTERNRMQSPLLRLPGEIRNQIYCQLIEDEDDLDPYWLTKNTNVYRRKTNLDWMSIQRWTNSYKLTGTCREIRIEFGTFLTSMQELGFRCFVHLYKWSKSASASTKRGIRSVYVRIVTCNSAPTLRRYMAVLRTLPDLEQVVVTVRGGMWPRDVQRQLIGLKDIAAKQNGRWKLVVEERRS